MGRHLIIWAIVFGVFTSCQTPHGPKIQEASEPVKVKTYRVSDSKIKEAKEYCKRNGYNQELAFFTNMDIRSGRKRFFIVSLKNDSVIDAGLVTHGHCKNYASRKPTFSNEVGSNCSSIGKYKIGYKYDGRFGTAYKLHGLESTNSNAFDRFVVLHSHGCVPETEAVVGICRSEGCPTVSPTFLKRLEPLIDNASEPILLWVYSD